MRMGPLCCGLIFVGIFGSYHRLGIEKRLLQRHSAAMPQAFSDQLSAVRGRELIKVVVARLGEAGGQCEDEEHAWNFIPTFLSYCFRTSFFQQEGGLFGNGTRFGLSWPVFARLHAFAFFVAGRFAAGLRFGLIDFNGSGGPLRRFRSIASNFSLGTPAGSFTAVTKKPPAASS
jgi:hypothetical protein